MPVTYDFFVLHDLVNRSRKLMIAFYLLLTQAGVYQIYFRQNRCQLPLKGSYIAVICPYHSGKMSRADRIP